MIICNDLCNRRNRTIDSSAAPECSHEFTESVFFSLQELPNCVVITCLLCDGGYAPLLNELAKEFFKISSYLFSVFRRVLVSLKLVSGANH